MPVAKTIAVPLAATALALLVALPCAAQDEVASGSHRGDISPGKQLAFHIELVSGAEEVEVRPPRNAQLAEEAEQAIAEAPAWIANDLRAQLRARPLGEQTRLAGLLAGLTDDRIVDEVTFTIAHMAPQAVIMDDLSLMVRNAELIYETVDLLDFVELVEHDDGDGAYTTLQYVIRRSDGDELWELERDDYYWFVVHPSFDVEYLEPVNPRTGRRANSGWLWREYFLGDDSDPERSHRLHWSLRQPDHLTDELLGGATWTTAPAHGAFVDFEIGPIELIRDAATGDPVAVTFVRGDGRCCNDTHPNPDGQFYATLMPLEQIAAERPEPLRNLLGAGTDNMALLETTLVGAAWGRFDEEERGVLIVRDRIPFDLAEDPNETLLAELGRTPDVVDSETFATMSLTTDEAPLVVIDYNKIVVPSDQPLALYTLLADRAEEIELFVDYGGVFELHGATRPEDDWSALRLPGGIRSTPQAVEGYRSAVTVAGFPDLVETLSGVEFLWDDDVHQGLSGDRLLDPEEGALAVVAWFVTQNMTTNVSEHAFWTRDSSPDRMQQPVRLLWQHYGNCGELQDVLGAASRSALLPVWLVSSFADDHVWNEFVALGRFHPYQVSWSDGPTFLDSWTLSADGDVGGGKTVSGMVGWRGDGWLENLLGRYEVEVDEEGLIRGDYTRYVTVQIGVTDSRGEPVDGALVILTTNNFYDPSVQTPATWGFTDLTGTATITVGDENHYWYTVRSAAGHFPELAASDTDPFDLDGISTSVLAHSSEVVAGAVLAEDVELDGDVGAPSVTAVDPPALEPGEERYEVAIDFDVERALLIGQSPYQRWTFMEELDDATADLFVVDADNLDRLEEGEEFEAILAARAVDAGTHTLELPEGSDYYVVLSNLGRSSTTLELTAAVTVSQLETTPPDAGPDGGPDGDGSPQLDARGGCGCSQPGAAQQWRPNGSALLQLLRY